MNKVLVVHWQSTGSPMAVRWQSDGSPLEVHGSRTPKVQLFAYFQRLFILYRLHM